MHLALQIIELLYFFHAVANVDRAGAVMHLDGGSEEKGDETFAAFERELGVIARFKSDLHLMNTQRRDL